MAKEEDTKIEEAAPADNESSADKGDSGNAGEAQGGGNSPTQKNKTGLGHQLYAILNRRWVWGSALALALALTGIFVFGGTQWTKRNDTKASTLSKQKLIQDDLRQEPLSRFYVPLPQDSSDRVLVIDFSVVWDSLSAVRFRKMELQVRDRLYAFMMEQVARGNDLQEKVSFLESEVGRILRESLRTEDLAIKIKEIRAF
jgi:hypothetical protein